jgi:hypothetical protein
LRSRRVDALGDLGVLVAEQLHARELRKQVVERALALGER